MFKFCTKSETRQFHFTVIQWQQQNATSCCFACFSDGLFYHHNLPNSYPARSAFSRPTLCYKGRETTVSTQLLFHRACASMCSLQTADVSPRSLPLRDVSRGGTSATQRQKFHTDDAKSVRNPVRIANWSTE